MKKSFIEQIEDSKMKRYIKNVPFHICALIFYLIGMSPSLAVVIDVILCVSASFISKNQSNRRFYRLLDQYCDPERFLIKLDEYEEEMEESDKLLNKINIDRALAYINLGEYHAAQDCLSAIDVTVLARNTKLYVGYILIMISCHYGLNEIEQAEKNYEKYKHIVLLSSDKYRDDIEILIAERLFYRKEYDKCYKHLSKLLNRKIKLRYRLFALYKLAMIDIEYEKENQAYDKLKEIVEKGNTLWIQGEANKHISDIKY